ncbi:hypothetical protein L1887_48192 [Cichorium endivia]|nr:hypothetical protein L1887_48192 [Cichorium endivia]
MAHATSTRNEALPSARSDGAMRKISRAYPRQQRRADDGLEFGPRQAWPHPGHIRWQRIEADATREWLPVSGECAAFCLVGIVLDGGRGCVVSRPGWRRLRMEPEAMRCSLRCGVCSSVGRRGWRRYAPKRTQTRLGVGHPLLSPRRHMTLELPFLPGTLRGFDERPRKGGLVFAENFPHCMLTAGRKHLHRLSASAAKATSAFPDVRGCGVGVGGGASGLCESSGCEWGAGCDPRKAARCACPFPRLAHSCYPDRTPPPPPSSSSLLLLSPPPPPPSCPPPPPPSSSTTAPRAKRKMNQVYELLDRGYVPDVVLASGDPAAQRAAHPIDRSPSPKTISDCTLATKSEYIRSLQTREIAIEQDKANEQHYEVDTGFMLSSPRKARKVLVLPLRNWQGDARPGRKRRCSTRTAPRPTFVMVRMCWISDVDGVRCRCIWQRGNPKLAHPGAEQLAHAKGVHRLDRRPARIQEPPSAHWRCQDVRVRRG